MIAVSFLKHCVDVVGHSVLSLLIERQQVGVVIECRKKFTVVWYAAALDAEPLLSVLQFTYKPMVVRELFRIAQHQQHGADDGARFSRDDGDACVKC